MTTSSSEVTSSSTSSNSSRLTWSTALILLEASHHSESLSPSLAPFLKSNLAALKRPHDPFPRSTASKTALQSGKLELVPKAKAVEVVKDDQTAALEVADRFGVDEVFAYKALSSARRAIEKDGRGTNREDQGKVGEEEWDRITAWLFEERMAVIGVVGLLLRTYDDPSHPLNELSTSLLPSVLTDTFAPSLLTAFTSRTNQALPDAVRSSPTHSPFWTKQLIREQKALLELVFLAFYSPRPADGSDLSCVLSSISSTDFGARQENFGYFDAETQSVVKEIGELLTLIALEAMNLENAMEVEYPISAPGEQDAGTGVDPRSVFSPENLVRLNEAVEAVVRVEGERSSPIVLGWAFLLSKVTHSLLERGVPDAYHAWAEKSLRSEGSGSSPQPLFQLYAAHALSPTSSLFPILLSILQSPLLGAPTLTSSSSSFSTADPNAVGYLSVLRGLLTSLPLLVRLPYLSAIQLDGLTSTFSALYGNPSSALLGAQFWEDQAVVAAAQVAAASAAEDEEDGAMESSLDRTAQSAGEAEIVELARSRFPVQFGGLVHLVRALCAGVAGLLPVEHAAEEHQSAGATGSDDELLAQRCAQSTFAYLATLPSLTAVLPPSASSANGGVEASSYPDAETGYSFRTTRAVAVSPSVVLSPGAQGRLVSQHGRKPVVVAWDCEWSAWRLFRDVLEEFAGLAGRKVQKDVFGGEGGKEGETLPTEWDSEEEKERDVTAVLDILRMTLRNDPALGPALIQHLSSPSTPSSASAPSRPRYEFIEVLFRILERALAAAPSASASRTGSATALVSSLLGLVSALLPSFPGVVWSFLRGSTLLFPSPRTASALSSRSSRAASSATSTPVLAAEKLAGQYPITLSLLSLTHALVLEEQVASCTSSAEYKEMKHGVLTRALNWIREEIWPQFGSWRFASLAGKYEVGRRCLGVFRLVVEEAELVSDSASATSPSSGPAQVVLSSFLHHPTTSLAPLAPLLTPLAQGPDAVLLLRKAGRYADAQALEDLSDASLSYLLQLLRYRRRTLPSTSSLLEKICLSSTAGSSFASSAFAGIGALPLLAALNGDASAAPRRPELLESLSDFVLAPTLEAHIGVHAAKAVTLLTLATANDGEQRKQQQQPSLSALLGGSEGAEKVLVGLLGVVEDPGASEALQVAVWDSISAIVDSQPGLALLLVTGRHYPFSTATDLVPSTNAAKDDKGKGKERTPAEESAQTLAKSIAPPSLRPLPRTALGVALETVGIWTEAWKERPALLAAVLRFFDFAFQHLDDYGASLDDFRKKPAAWDAFVKIALENLGAEPEDEQGVAAYCHRAVSKAHAVRILALDMQATLKKHKAEEATSVKAFLTALKDAKRLNTALSSAISTSCSPDLHQGIFSLIRSTFPELDLDLLRHPASTHPLDEARQFGSGYLYSLSLVRRKLDGFRADSEEGGMIGAESLDDVIDQTARLNLNFSLLEAQILETRSWRQVLEIVLPVGRKDQALAETVLGAAGVVAKEIAQEKRVGAVMTTVQAERLSILLTLVQVLDAVPAEKGKTALIDLVGELSTIFSSEALGPLESVARRATPAYHATLFRIAFFAFRQLNTYLPADSPSSPTSLSTEQRTKLTSAAEAILRIMLTATRDVLVLARASKDLELEQDLSLAVAVVSQLLKSAFAPSAAIWLAHANVLDLHRCAFEVFVHMEQLEPGRPLYAQHVLDLCLAFATSSPRAAEQLALDGVMTALTNNALTSAAESGAIALVSPVDGSRTPQHELWTGMLALVVALVAALGDSTRFVEQDVTGFVRLYGAQIVLALSWTSDAAVTAAGLEELTATVATMHGIARSSTSSAVSTSGSSSGNSPVVVVASVFVEQSLHLLQHLVYALLHPNHLAALVEGLTPEERGWLEKEGGEADLEQKPVASAVRLKMVELARDVVGGLVEFSDCWTTLLKDPTEWRSDRAVVLPTATVTASEKASLGTLFDLSSYCIDTLRSTSTATPPSFPSPSPFPSLPQPSSAVLRVTCAETLEACLLLSAAQLGLHAKASASGQGSATSTRTLNELGSETVDLVDKAIGTSVSTAGGKAEPNQERNRKALLEIIKVKLGLWV
ncbi:hypothetical protein JCM11641_008047 [Rhodosporidiobolus odoratus]